MPLSHLTSDSGPDEHPADTALPRTTPDRWTRPYRPGPWRVAAAALLLVLASYVLFAAVIITAAGALPVAGICLGAAVLVITGALRLLHVGVWICDQGLRQSGLLHTTTVPWGRVGSVRTAQQPVKWLGLPRTLQGQAVIVTRKDGQELRPVVTDHNADFLGRGEAFDVAADAIEGWAIELGRAPEGLGRPQGVS